MKATRRQELRTNTLVERTNELVQYIQAKSQVIVIAILAVILVIGVTLYWQRSARAKRAEGWKTMLTLLQTTREQDPQVLEKMEQVAGSFSDAHLRAMAYSQLGTRLANEALVAESDEAAKELNGRAEAAFQAVLGQTPNETVPAAVAQLGMATLAANRGDFDAAKRYYEGVGNNEKLKGTPYVAQASAGLTSLETTRNLPPLAATSQPAAATQPAASSQPAQG